VDKTFEFEGAESDYARLVAALASAPGRIAAMVDGLSEAQLRQKSGGSWSIKENVGHLVALEALFVGRLDGFDAGLDELRAADMSNRATDDAGHNEADIQELVEGFRRVREACLARLADKPVDYFARVARHPRLQKPMRIVDQLEFQVAHDAHHFARLAELI